MDLRRARPVGADRRPWVGAAGIALAIAGAAFPVSRITRSEPIAHVADLLVLAAFAVLAVAYLRRIAPQPAATAP